MPKFLIGEVCEVLCSFLYTGGGDQWRRAMVTGLPGKWKNEAYEVKVEGLVNPLFGEIWLANEQYMRKLPPDDTRDALPRWCRNLFDIDMDQSQPVRKPVNNSK